MKQGTLSFASAKRTNSIPSGKKAFVTEKGKSKRVESLSEVQVDAKSSDVLQVSSNEDDIAAIEKTIPVKRTRTSTNTQPSSGTVKQSTSKPEGAKPSPAEIEREYLDVSDKARRYRKYHNKVRSKLEYVQPIHSEGQNKIHQMLCFFDMSFEFGPCIGMTRLERWKRAEALGLNPPVEVRDILLTKQGIEMAEYAECVLHDEV